MSESVDSVKYVIEDLRKWADNNRAPERLGVLSRFTRLIEHLELVEDDLIMLHGLTSALPTDLGNIHDLPEELLAELNVTKTDELEDQLVTVINTYGGEANLDQILVGLYRKFKVSQKRRVVQNKLYRMEMVWSVGGKKGVYTTTEPNAKSEDDDFYDGDMDEEIPF